MPASNGRPIIGITSSMTDGGAIRMNRSYFNAVYAAGGIPVYLPYSREAEGARDYFANLGFDGIIFGGGVDVAPARYGEEITAENVEISEARDNFELTMAEEALKTDIPLLGICRGIQLMNVALGGTLHQDIPGHRQEEPGKERPQPIKITAGTRLYDILGFEDGFVNSFHHQAVKDVAPGFRAAAYSPADGFIEAIEPAVPTDRFILGVQWHPELFYSYHESSRAVFGSFVDAAKIYSEKTNERLKDNYGNQRS